MVVMKKRLFRRFGVLLGVSIIFKLLGASDALMFPIVIGLAMAQIWTVTGDYIQSLEDLVIEMGALQKVYARVIEERVEKLESLTTKESEGQ